MKKQASKTSSRRLATASANTGEQIAQLSSVLNEKDVAMTLNPVHPIDTLLVQQLENLLASERTIRARYAAVDSSANTPELRQSLSQELSTLRDRTDRLYRLMDAMDCYAPYGGASSALYSPAFA